MSNPTGLGVDAQGQTGGRVLRLDSSGSVLATFALPGARAVAVGPNGAVWVTTTNNGRVTLIR